MRIRAHWAVFAAASLLLAACAGGPKYAPPSTDIDEGVFRDDVRVLASDAFEGRKPGTPGEEKTLAYLVEQFQRLGLKPGNGGSFLQQVPMVETLAGSDAVLSAAGHGRSVSLAYGRDVVVWSKLAQPQTELKGSEMVFVGYGIVAPEYGWNDYADFDVHGKTVVVLANDPGYAAKDPKVFKGGTQTYYGRWAYKIEEAARRGAAAVLLIHDDAAVGFGWNVVRNTWTGPQLELASGNGSAVAHAAIEGWVQKEAARALFGAAELDLSALAAAAAHAGFKAVPLGLRADAILHNSVRWFSSANVVALLPGGSRHKEYVLYTAHWDHLGRDPALPGHNVFNGAVDNATGVAGLLALAQSFARTKPVAERSMVFLALTGAESGLLGSKYYVENPIFPLSDTAAVLDLEGLRNGGPTRDLTVYGFGNSDLDEYARPMALLQGRELTPEPNPERGLYYRSDCFTFARAGIPSLYAVGGLDDSARGPVWGRANLEDYLQHRYRQLGDQYSADWDVRGALDDLRLYYEVGERVARAHRFPRWNSNSEYRVGREHSPEP
jgi:Zn-dependent M28 family amino/carboxypeptidase